LAIIASELPHFTAQTAIDLLRQHYGIVAVQAQSLVSERDQNFRLRTVDGRRLVLKIANAAEDPLVTDFQIRALQHIENFQREHGTRFNAPRIIATRDGSPRITIRDGDTRNVARLVTFVDGQPVGDEPPSVELCRGIGVYLAELGRSLFGFEHDGAHQSLLWDMKRASDLRDLLPVIPDAALRLRVASCLDDFETYAFPFFDELRWQVIHNDLNPDNVLVDPADRSSVVGVIDFGDMLKSPLIVDLAVAASYLRLNSGNPLSGVASFIAGYHSVTRLERNETDLLFDLIRVRLAATISIRHWRISERSPEDPYLKKILQENSAEDFLVRLDELPRDSVRRTFREVCASQDVASQG
jgi:Ser/Thr protein kinase RdoA (MazF antagonist)